MSSKHIALFIRYLPVGGIQKIVVLLANGFAKRGHRVDLVLAKEAGALVSELSSDVRIVNLGKDRVWTALPALVAYLRQNSPDVLLAAEAPANLVAIWAKILSSRRVRLVISVHSNMTQQTKSGETWYARLMPTMIKLFFPLADRIIAVSRGVLADLSTISARASRRGCVIYNPVVDDSLYEKAGRPVSHGWFSASNVPVILAVGRLTRQKNFALLLNAFARLRKEKDVRLVILGDGNQRRRLEEQVEALGLRESVDLPGFVVNPYSYMARASLFVLSSDFEGFGIVLVEALACGCPVVSTDCPSGPREILEDGNWGHLVRVGRASDLADAIECALSEPVDRERLRSRAMDFSVDKAVDQYLEILLWRTN